MLLTLMKAKIHRAAVTQADLEYEGSIAIDRTLLREAGIFPHEQVHVYDVNNGNRFITYAIEAPESMRQPGKPRTICVNGAAARLVSPGDKVIIVAYAQFTTDEAPHFKPRVLLVNDQNEIK